MSTNEQNKAQHTPGPWFRNIRREGKYPVIFSGRNNHVACASQQDNADETEANIDLIAAAPELLEALRKVTLEASHFLHGKRDNGTFLENELKNALAAIAKATGEGKQ